MSVTFRCPYVGPYPLEGDHSHRRRKIGKIGGRDATHMAAGWCQLMHGNPLMVSVLIPRSSCDCTIKALVHYIVFHSAQLDTVSACMEVLASKCEI